MDYPDPKPETVAVSKDMLIDILKALEGQKRKIQALLVTKNVTY